VAGLPNASVTDPAEDSVVVATVVGLVDGSVTDPASDTIPASVWLVVEFTNLRL
jgi:hypothetical protein